VKLLFRRVQFWLGMIPALPADYMKLVQVTENGEPLVAIRPSLRLILKPYSLDSTMKARSSAVSRLYEAADSLPADMTLIVVDAFRSQAYQQARWEQRIKEMSARMPGASREQIENAAQKFTARPMGSGHQTGGAFDVTIGDLSGEELDLGTGVKEATQLTPTKADGLSKKQIERRALLTSAMQKVGFANYPLEWWHFSYGDRLWAAYTGQRRAIYDALLLDS
jgi:D-alanyl-D-alanine dipeptidase